MPSAVERVDASDSTVHFKFQHPLHHQDGEIAFGRPEIMTWNDSPQLPQLTSLIVSSLFESHPSINCITVGRHRLVIYHSPADSGDEAHHRMHRTIRYAMPQMAS